jgi:transposase/predicted nucleic acid-binding protein
MGCYELDDRAAQRSLWVQVYRAGHATQVQISRYLKIGLRTFHGWVGRYRESGMAGLLDQPKSGRPREADASKQKLVVRSRAAGKTIYEIAQIANLSVSTINRILGRKQPKPAPVQELALGTSASSESPLARVIEPALIEPAADQRALGVEASSVPVIESIPVAAVVEVQPMLAEKALPVAVAGTPVEHPGFVADSSLLVRLYLHDRNSESIERFLSEDAKVVSLSALARVEVLNVLLRQESRAGQFLADLDEGVRLRLQPVDWPKAFQQAESLARRFSLALRPGGRDLILVAAAVTMGGTWFLSFDRHSRQRPLAAAAGLRVWPPLEKDEKGLVKHASQQAAD